MNINKDITINEIKIKIKDKTKSGKLFCFGAGAIGTDFSDFAINNGISKNDIIFVDNFNHDVKKNNIDIISKDKMLEIITCNDIIVITTLFCKEVYDDLISYEKLKNIELCFYALIYRKEWSETKVFSLKSKSEIEIPKVIHYCWFGSSELPIELQKYINTWQKKCPNYIIKRWDESNYDISKNNYMYEAYKSKNWGFVPDYARLDIIYEHGGIYLDTDVETLQNFDILLNQSMFCSFSANGKINLGNGFGAVPKHKLIKAMRDEYKDISFINNDGSFNILPCMEYQHKTLIKYNSKYKNNWKSQEFNDFVLLPTDITCGYDHYLDEYIITENTISVHHSKRSWHDEVRKANAIKSTKFLQSIKNSNIII